MLFKGFSGFGGIRWACSSTFLVSAAFAEPVQGLFLSQRVPPELFKRLACHSENRCYNIRQNERGRKPIAYVVGHKSEDKFRIVGS